MSLRPKAVPPQARPPSRLDEMLFADLFRRAASIEATKKRTKDGELAATRLGQAVTNRWFGERFRQTMMLVLEFRLHHTLLSRDDVEFIRVAVDMALAEAGKAAHVGDIYDMNPTIWAGWLVQHAYATRTGGWAVTSMQEQINLSFAGLYTFLQHQHALGLDRNLRDPLTNRVIRRYKLPVKKMNVPPRPGELFKWKKGARRLSDWMVAGGLPPLHPGIVAQAPPTPVTELPPGADQAAAQRDAQWQSLAARARELQLQSTVGDDAEDKEAREFLASLMYESRIGGGDAGGDGAGPSTAANDSDDELLYVRAERVGPALPLEETEDELQRRSELLAELQRFSDSLMTPEGAAEESSSAALEETPAPAPAPAEDTGEVPVGPLSGAATVDAPLGLDALAAGVQEKRTAWAAAAAAVVEAQAKFNAREKVRAKQCTELNKRQKTAATQTEGSDHALRLNEECEAIEITVEAARQATETARTALQEAQAEERRRNDALDVVVTALNDADTHRRGAPEKWREMHARGGTVFRKAEHPLRLPSAKTVGEQTAFRSIFNGGFDKNGVPVKSPDGVGDRWHGREAAGGGEDAAWVAPYDAAEAAWLGEGRLNWLATTSKPGSKVVTDTHALKAGVDRRGKNATTPEQTPLHADSCWPNSHAAARAPWGDAHLVMITALQDGTRLPYYPFDRGGQRKIAKLNAGDVFVFRGDLVHVGAEYDSLNIRIHSYVDSPCAPEPRDADTTYHVLSDSWPIGRR